MLGRILGKIDAARLTERERILQFFKSNVELEQLKEPDIREYYRYPINYRGDDTSTILIDIPCDYSFYSLFEENRDRRRVLWPKNLYMGLCITLENELHHILGFNVPFEQFKDIVIEEELLPCRFSSFSVNTKAANKLELNEDQIRTIETGIASNPSFAGVSSALKSVISPDLELVDGIFLALSQKNPSLSQIYSELDRLKDQEINRNPLLSDFLLNKEFKNRVDNEVADTVLQVTKLDSCQRNAVAVALNSRFSVITGPPGCGKTQVILNILANALVKGKKVLVASKNNKAVDNVKERFDILDPSGYFLRFGTKLHIQTSTLPTIDSILREMAGLNEASQSYNELILRYASCKKDWIAANAKLEKKASLAKYVQDERQQLIEKERNLIHLRERHAQTVSALKMRYADVSIHEESDPKLLERISAELDSLLEEIHSRSKGFLGFLFNWLYRRKLAEALLSTVEKLPEAIKTSPGVYASYRRPASFHSSHEMTSFAMEYGTFLKRVLNFLRELKETNTGNEKELGSAMASLEELEKSHRNNKEELRALTVLEPSLQLKISQSAETIRGIGLDLLREAICHHKQMPHAVHDVRAYRSYLPDNIPWKANALSVFITDTRRFLDVFMLNSVTSLSVKSAFPLEKELFDMVIIDEASQCDIASAIPLLYRTKQIVVIGDPNQLRHITTNTREEEQKMKDYLRLSNRPYVRYTDRSLWDYANEFLSHASDLNQTLSLNGHYRCHPDIIGYSNEVFYRRQLQIFTEKNVSISPNGIFWEDVEGKQENDNININEMEARRSVALAVTFSKRYPEASIGIVTPFRHQAERISSIIPENYSDRIIADTVHRYQGDEKDIMIYSLVVTSNSPDGKIRWIDYGVPNLVNVAVTRAKSLLVIVGNSKYVETMSKASSPLGYLVRYAKHHSSRL